MELLKAQQMFAEAISILIEEIVHRGYEVTLGEAYRTKEQAEIYAKEGKGILHSLHCERLAIDLNIFKDSKELLTKEELQQFGDYWEAMHEHHRWGGNFMVNGKPKPDSDHYEMRIL